MKKKRSTAITIFDSNGQTIADERKNRVAEKLTRIMTVIMFIIAMFISSAKKVWEQLAVVPEKKSCEDEEAEKEQIYKECRNEIAATLGIVLITVIFGISGKLPLIIEITGLLEACIVIYIALTRRDAIREGKKLKKEEKHLYKEAARVLKAFFTMVLILTVFAIVIKSGKISSVTEMFPLLDKFAEWQVAQVNEVLSFLDDMIHGRI